jgi:hypothetical protein
MQSFHHLESNAIPLPIPASLQRQVQARILHESNPEKRSQLHRNLLAVGLVKNYLEMMQFAVDLTASDSWNPVMQRYADVSDLYLPNLGYLECRLLQAGQEGCQIPADVPDDRLGVVVVAVNSMDDKHARLVGFSRRVQPGWLAVDQLQSIDDALQYLTDLETQASAVPLTVQLGQWLQGVLTMGWQTLDALLGTDPSQMAYVYAFRQGNALQTADSQAEAGKLIELATADGYLAVVLVVVTTLHPNQTVGLRVQVHPAQGERFLPDHLKLSLLTHQNECLQEVLARQTDNFIQLPYFNCAVGEPFKVRITYGETQMTETFRG